MTDRSPGRPAASDDLLRELLVAQAKTDARFDEVFRRLGLAEGAAGEARDTGKEVLTVLREQNAMVKIEEVRAEAAAQVAAVRHDLVHAVDTARKAADARQIENDVAYERLEGRVIDLEDAAKKRAGMFVGARWLVEGMKVVLAAGGGALLAKIIG